MVCFDLCVITAQAERPRRGHVDVARAALEGGATIIQLREKELPGRAMLELAEQIRALTREHGAAFVVNDRVDIVLAAEADGAHLGVDDMPIAAARRLLGAERLIGASVDNPSDAAEAQAAGASYLGVGPVFPTGSKADAGDAIGLGPIGAIKRTVSIPVLAIGSDPGRRRWDRSDLGCGRRGRHGRSREGAARMREQCAARMSRSSTNDSA
jgi:thiamine-phosphate pyrophosphorylase